MPTAHDHARGLLDFIDRSPTPFHAVQSTAALLEAAGFRRLSEAEAWSLSPGDRRYLVRNDSSIVAFAVGAESPERAGFSLVGAHTDSPCLKVKPVPELTRSGLFQLAVEPYGGMLLSTWLDRDLGLAGRVLVAAGTGAPQSRFVHLRKPLLRVPNLAIHLDREVNTRGLVLNPQQHLVPILGLDSARPDGGLRGLLAAELSQGGAAVSPQDVLDFDLALFDAVPGTFGGLGDAFVYAPRLDNLASCHAALSALTASVAAQPQVGPTRVVAFWDHEECGSRSAQGAMGPLILTTLERIVEARAGGAPQAAGRALAASMLVSADMAHAVHPNYADRHEPSHQPALGGGPVVKVNHNQSYATDGFTSAVFTALCRACGFEPQRFVTRSDLPCGSTIGPITAALTGVHAVDVGNPMLSMHSIREMAGVEDHARMIAVLGRFFSERPAMLG